MFIIIGITVTTILLQRVHRWGIEYGPDGKVRSKTRSALGGEAGAFWLAYIVILGLGTVIFVAG